MAQISETGPGSASPSVTTTSVATVQEPRHRRHFGVVGHAGHKDGGSRVRCTVTGPDQRCGCSRANDDGALSMLALGRPACWRSINGALHRTAKLPSGSGVGATASQPCSPYRLAR
jgi:hypothetical protein